MRNIIFLMHVSLDGYVAGPNGEMDWIVLNDEVYEYIHGFHARMDAAIYGRVTYEMMKGYWPKIPGNPEASLFERQHADWLQKASKIAVSTTLESDDWANMIIGGDLANEITRLKEQDGKDIWLLGSPTLTQSLMKLRLIDDYRLLVTPIILGNGKRLFAELESPLNLTLVETKTFLEGVVLLRYVP